MFLPERVILAFPFRIRYFKWKSSILAAQEGHFSEGKIPLTTHSQKSILGPSDLSRFPLT